MFRQVRQRYPRAIIYINLLGFDEDPREVWQIPLARKFFRRWAKALDITDPEIAEQQSLDPTSIGTLAACGAFGDDVWRPPTSTARINLGPGRGRTMRCRRGRMVTRAISSDSIERILCCLRPEDGRHERLTKMCATAR
jgi:hypothetical protein